MRPYPPYPPRPPAAGKGARRRRGARYRAIIAAGFLGGALLVTGGGALVLDQLQEAVEQYQNAGPALPGVQGPEGEPAEVAGDGAPLAEQLEDIHEGIDVDWEAGPRITEGGLDRGRPVEDAPGVLLIDTVMLQGIGTGTGMVVSESGLAVTNYHVVEGSSEVNVTVADTGEDYTATVLGRDALHDVAVLQLQDAHNLEVASISTDEPHPGKATAAVGNGTGQGYLTAVTGEVTAVDESIFASAQGQDDYARLSGLIATDADVVPGYSGGPLVDANGQVIGITVAASEGQTTGEVDGFAIPVTTALDVVEQVLSGEETDSVSIGVDGALGIVIGTEAGQAAVLEVAPGSAAEQLGLEPGDEITAVAGQPVGSGAEVSEAISGREVGEVVEVEWTDEAGQAQSGTVALQEAVVN